jgi:hypothetical protein
MGAAPKTAENAVDSHAMPFYLGAPFPKHRIIEWTS